MASSEVHLYTYQWNTKIDWEHIDCFALTKTGDIVYLRIEGFTPYLYLELPSQYYGKKIKWDKNTRSYLIEYIRETYEDVCDIIYEKKRKLYFTGLEYDIEEKTYKHRKHDFFFVSFKTKEKLIGFKNSMRYEKNIDGIGKIKFQIYEEFIDTVLQFHSRRNISPSSWITAKVYTPKEKLSKCEEEYYCNWKDVLKCTHPQYQNTVPRPRIAAIDFEAYSSNWNAMPSSKNPKDVLFQAGIVYCTQGEKESQWKKRIISMGKLDPETVRSKDVSIEIDDGYDTEQKFISAYFDFLNEYNPAIIVSYNGFGWDFLYLAERCLLQDCMSALNHSLLLDEKYDSYTKKWSSSAMRNQNYYIPKISGRLYIDLLPIVRSSPVFRLDSYSLNAVATFLLGTTKDDVSAKQIFKYFEKGDPISLGIVGKYCVQDSNVTLKIFDKMKTWFDLTETSCVINLPIIECFTVGQQQKTMAQLYKECIKPENNIVITRNEFHDENDRYRGANVAYPITGVHQYVVSEDFASLYPSIIISNNLDFSTYVPDAYVAEVDDNLMTEYEWHDAYGCPHDTDLHDSKIPATKMLCKDRKFHFLKEPKGILPSILENLLRARKQVKKEMEEAENKAKETKDPDERFELEQLALVLDKRQNALKISSNSGYGVTGVKKGKIPCMPVAQTTTYIGRQSFQKIYKLVESEAWDARRIYGDTDSCYLIFNNIKDPMICEEKAIQFSKEATKLFPPPMKLDYEKKIYRVFLLISKKKYVYIICDKNGKIEMDKDKSGNYTDKYKIYKKGVLLTRRDNTKFMKEVYQTLIQDIIDSTLKNISSDQLYNSIVDYLINALNRLYSKSLNITQLTITKSIKENIDYKIRALPDDPAKRKKRLEKLECMDESEYIIKALPAIVQLAEKMRRRGQYVPAGSRIEYLFLDVGDMKANQWKKVESLQYYKEHSSSLRLDFIHYNKLLINPIDQLLNIVKSGSKFMEEHFKDRILKYQAIEEMKAFFTRKIKFVKEPTEK